METMNYNKEVRKKPKAGIVFFSIFTLLGSALCFYMIKNEPQYTVLGQDMYIPAKSSNVDIYTEEVDVSKIEYSIKNDNLKTTSGKFKSNIQVPKITVDDEELTDINNNIYSKFVGRYNSVKDEVTNLENTFTYKVTYNKYESTVNNNRFISFTFYERIIDNSTGEDITYKLYGYTIDLAKKKVVTQDEAALILLGSTYKTIIKEKVKDYVISKKLFDLDTYLYVLTGFEEYYVKEERLHIMFNVGEMGDNKDYLDIVIN